MNCNCRNEIERTFLTKHKDRILGQINGDPEHAILHTDPEFDLTYSNLSVAYFDGDKGKQKRKKFKMIHEHCPFCGKKYEHEIFKEPITKENNH